MAILHWVHMSGFCCALEKLPHSVALRGRSSVPHLVSLVRWVREEFEKTRVFRSKETRVFRSKGPEAFFFRLEVVIVLIFAAVLILGFSREIPHLHISY